MKKILLTFIFSSFLLSKASAQQRSLEKVKSIAFSSVSSHEAPTDNAFSTFCYDAEGKKLAKSSNELQIENAPFYIFSDTVTSSFVIVSGDERMKEVLAVGDHFPEMDGGGIPEGLVGLLESYRLQYEQLQAGEIIPENAAMPIDIPNVEPMLKTKWRQGMPYNNLCPKGCPSGCVATAMSQVMNYHQFPSSGLGSFSYSSRSRGFKCSYNFENAIFYWDRLKNTYPTSTLGTISGAEEIAQITYACGVSVGMDYDSDGSGAYMSDVPYALIHFFGYNDNVSYRDRTCYSNSEWYEMLCKELQEGRPVVYGGVDSKNGGHAFVIEGCNSRTKRFYVNWGWGGDFDGEYELDALDPSAYRFSSYQSMIVNVSPQLVGDYGDIFYADRFTFSKGIQFDRNISFTLHDLYCYSSQSSYVVSSAKFKGEVGVALFDKDFNFISYIDKKAVDGLNNFDGFSSISFSAKLSKSLFPDDGTYYIAPFVRAASSTQPTRIRTSGGRTDYVTINVSEEDINGNGDDEQPSEPVSFWSENFEYAAVPEGWSQQSELGESLWEHRYVLQSSDDMPLAAKGRGYISLKYATSMQDQYNTRTVTRLETRSITLAEDKNYELSLQCRKYATLPESTDLLSVFYEKDGEWYVLSELPVTSQGEWNKKILPLPVTGTIRLAFEGSPSKGAMVFLDDLLINVCHDDTRIKIPNLNSLDVTTVYSLMGVRRNNVRKGMNIVKMPDGTVIKFMSK